MKAAFIVVDGLGGSGKTTHLNLLIKRLGRRALLTQEPGGAPRAERIRKILKSGKGPKPDPLADFFLFWAARAEHVNVRIKPALKRGRIVICDRFDSSTFAIQVRGEGQKELEKLFWQCRLHVLADCEPDLYIILDTPEKLARSRRSQRRKVEDRFDDKGSNFQKKVRAGYLEFAKRVGSRALVIDGSLPPEDVQERIWKALRARQRTIAI